MGWQECVRRAAIINRGGSTTCDAMPPNLNRNSLHTPFIFENTDSCTELSMAKGFSALSFSCLDSFVPLQFPTPSFQFLSGTHCSQDPSFFPRVFAFSSFQFPLSSSCFPFFCLCFSFPVLFQIARLQPTASSLQCLDSSCVFQLPVSSLCFSLCFPASSFQFAALLENDPHRSWKLAKKGLEAGSWKQQG